MTTFMASAKTIKPNWHLINAEGKVLGRLATEIARCLRGKHKAEFTPHVDTGDFIIVINAAKLVLTGKKTEKKAYHSHSGVPGNLKTIVFKDLQAKHPGRALEIAVKGMLPKGPLGRAMFGKLKVYAGNEHPHEAQQPQSLATE